MRPVPIDAVPRQNHDCPIDGCQVSVPWSCLLCRTHWMLVPRPLRKPVWDTWDGGRGWGSPAHRAACVAAIRAVYRVLGQPIPEDLEQLWIG